MKHILASILVAIAVTFLTASAASAQAPDSIKTATIRVANLHCNGDMPTIKKQLLNQDGIDDVAFTERDGEVSVFTVTYHSSVTNPASIESAIERTPGCDDKSETPYRVQRERGSKKKKS